MLAFKQKAEAERKAADEKAKAAAKPKGVTRIEMGYKATWTECRDHVAK